MQNHNHELKKAPAMARAIAGGRNAEFRGRGLACDADLEMSQPGKGSSSGDIALENYTASKQQCRIERHRRRFCKCNQPAVVRGVAAGLSVIVAPFANFAICAGVEGLLAGGPRSKAHPSLGSVLLVVYKIVGQRFP